MKIQTACSLLLSAPLLMATSLWAETVTIEPSKDNSMFSEADDSNGQGLYLFVGRTNTPSNRRALLAFDLAAAIPAGATIESASLSLTMNKTNVGAQSISVHRLGKDWGEGASDAVANEGKGAPAQAGDVTWSHTFFPSSFWASAGGDFTASPSATQSVSGNGTYSWSGAGMVADVQAWVDTPSANFGWILIGPESATSSKRFASRENTGAASRPTLTVTYTTAPVGWAGYPVNSDGRTVDTGGWLGLVDIATAPWAYLYSLDSYIYADENDIGEAGGWIWLAR